MAGVRCQYPEFGGRKTLFQAKQTIQIGDVKVKQAASLWKRLLDEQSSLGSLPQAGCLCHFHFSVTLAKQTNHPG